MRLSGAQRRVLRTMLEFECPVYLSLDFYESSFGHCWFGEQGLFAYSRNVVNRSTVLSLLNRGLIVERRRPGKPPNWTTVFILTPKGREKAEELQDAD